MWEKWVSRFSHSPFGTLIETKIHWLKSQDPKDKLSSKVFICITSPGGDIYGEGKEQVLQLQTKEL